MTHQIVIAGFGRSGTTWMSDILSKTVGGLILFEPCHPQVCNMAKQWAYDGSHDIAIAQKTFLKEITHSEEVHPWLLRNHLRNPMEEVPSAYVNDVWRHCEVIGYKTIRWNHNLRFIGDSASTKVVYMLRHPLSVIASLLRRESYWVEFGWKFHWDTLQSKVPIFFAEDQHEKLEVVASGLTQQAEKIAFMWAVSTSISLRQVSLISGRVVKYEDLYTEPYGTTRSVLSYLERAAQGLHPSYIFEPSMTTHRTFHTEKDNSQFLEDFPSYFWKDSITRKEGEKFLQIINRVLQITEVDKGYYSGYNIF